MTSSEPWRALACGLLLLGCQVGEDGPGRGRWGGASGAGPDPDGPGNVLIVIIDDVGIDQVGMYGVSADPPPTPTLDGLAAEGVRFRNAWAHPTCSPSRAALLTGRHPRRYGIGRWIDPPRESVRLPDEEVTLPQLLGAAEERWDSSLVGKWHLTGFLDRDDAADDPARKGFDWHAGSLGNLTNALADRGDDHLGYERWEKDTNGALAQVEEYATTVTASDAIDRIAGMQEPWLLVVAFNAAHSPIRQGPPPELTTTEGLSAYASTVEVMDHELGRVLDAVPDHTLRPTTVMVLSDNGTAHDQVDPALGARGAKGTPYELGVRVPFVVSSPLLPERGVVSDALVHVVDVFATVAELAGLDPAALERPDGGPLVHDSVSLVPYLRDPRATSAREVLYAEAFGANGPPPYPFDEVGARTLAHKYVREGGIETLYRLRADGLEGEELLGSGARLSAADLAALARLRAAADEGQARPYEY